MIKNGLEPQVADRIVHGHLTLGAMMDRVEESQEREEVVKWGEAGAVEGIPHLIMAQQRMFHNHTLFR